MDFPSLSSGCEIAQFFVRHTDNRTCIVVANPTYDRKEYPGCHNAAPHPLGESHRLVVANCVGDLCHDVIHYKRTDEPDG